MMRVFILLIIVALQACNVTYPPFEEATAHLRDESLKPFYHGVASGDPKNNSIVIWTRVTPETMLREISVSWEVSESSTFEKIVKKGEIKTIPDKDYTVKVIVEGLKPASQYFYRFKALGSQSQVGKFYTAPVDDMELRFGVVSCSNYEWGYFNSYAALAKEDLHAVIHLGDYIYEYGTGGYGDTTTGRVNLPAHEIISLQDYRTRYAQYRLDPDLQAAHAAHAFINIWDDHEISNDAYKSGAQNHQDEEGPYDIRKAAAIKAFYEWIPIRGGEQHYRVFDYGVMADIIMLDERLEARTKPAENLSDPILSDSAHTMLGNLQMKWLKDRLKEEDSQWKIIGNQVIFSYLNWGHQTFNINMDSWDGYPIDQDRLAKFIREKPVPNVIFVTGDTHSAWAFEVTHKPFDEYNPSTGEGAFAIEFGTTSINSSNSNERFPDSLVRLHEKKIVNTPINPHLKYANLRDHGYMILTLKQDEAVATWRFVETLTERNATIKETIQLRTLIGSNRISTVP